MFRMKVEATSDQCLFRDSGHWITSGTGGPLTHGPGKWYLKVTLPSVLPWCSLSPAGLCQVTRLLKTQVVNMHNAPVKE